MLTNEFEKSHNSATGYYKMFMIEKIMRLHAERFSNAFFLALFPCCREVNRKDRHCGCFGGSAEEAKDQYQKQADQRKKDQDEHKALGEHVKAMWQENNDLKAKLGSTTDK